MDTEYSDTVSAVSEKDEKANIAPLFYFLASSLNVELVYTILKSVTQFVYICPVAHEYTVCKKKTNQIRIIKRATKDHVTLELSSIKIKNYSNWSPSSGSDLYQS